MTETAAGKLFADDPRDRVAGDFERRVEDAGELLEWAIASGTVIDDRLVRGVKEAEDLIQDNAAPTGEERTRFETAYRDLAQALAPVTIHTLGRPLIDTADRSACSPRATVDPRRRSGHASSGSTRSWS